MQAVVDILTVTKDRFHFLIEASKSVREQTYENWRWYILDESAEDGVAATREYLNNLQDSRIKYFPVPLDKSKSPFTTRRNELLDKASTKYFCVLNDDDYFLPEKLERMVHAGETSWADMICCSVGIVNNPHIKAPLKAIQKAEPKRLSVESIRQQNPLDIGGMMFCREAYENTYGLFNERLSTAEDWDILYRSAVMGAKIATIPEVLHLYRQHALQTIHRVKDEPEFGRIHQHDLDSIRAFEEPQIFVYLPSNSLTTSQKIVCERIIEEGWKEPLRLFNYSQNAAGTKDLLLCLAPFLYSSRDILTIKRFPGTKIAIQMEDPWALGTNIQNAMHFDSIYTNDISGFSYYKGIDLGVLPTNSIAKSHAETISGIEKEYDLALIGYAYPSRKQEIERLIPLFQKYGLRILLVGEGWSKFQERKIAILHSIATENMVALLNKARYVLCLEREVNDVSGCFSGLSPNIPSRGYIEYVSTAIPIFKRYQRDIERFGPVLVYNSMKELEDILTGEPENIRPDWRPWTYRNRIGKVIATWIAGRKARWIE